MRSPCLRCKKGITGRKRPIEIILFLEGKRIKTEDIFSEPALCEGCRAQLLRNSTISQNLDSACQTESQVRSIGSQTDAEIPTTALGKRRMSFDKGNTTSEVPFKLPKVGRNPTLVECAREWEKEGAEVLERELEGLLGHHSISKRAGAVVLKTKAFEVGMKKGLEENKELFTRVSFLLHSLGGIGQRKMQDIIRNSIFQLLVPLLKINNCGIELD